jgi:hypothetical protein
MVKGEQQEVDKGQYARGHNNPKMEKSQWIHELLCYNYAAIYAKNNPIIRLLMVDVVSMD